LRVLVTGAAGFIGYHLSKFLLEDNIDVYGVDSINDYYDVALKKDRLEILQNYSNFKFSIIDLIDREKISRAFEDYKPNKVVNLAAQAGVRHSIRHPHTYIDSNIIAFMNIIELCRHNNTEGLIYASSSSVYGGNKKNPFSVDDRVDNPISLYAATKKANELIANSYSHLYGLHTTGLRFFTVYGPWGRPDMAMYLSTDKILKGEKIQVFNNGNMKRDFTYIDDIVYGIRSALDKNYKCEIFNLGNNHSEDLMDIIRLIEKNINKKAKIEFLPMQPGDVKESCADIDKSIKMLNFNPKIKVAAGLKSFINWYKIYTKDS
jgi:UDP-glucuronate 4-epimerase